MDFWSSGSSWCFLIEWATTASGQHAIQPDLLQRKLFPNWKETTGHLQTWICSKALAPHQGLHSPFWRCRIIAMDQLVAVPPIGQWPWRRKALTPTTETPKPFWISRQLIELKQEITGRRYISNVGEFYVVWPAHLCDTTVKTFHPL
ncbi:hypothetical protein BDP55DRAFT_635378 [Colletotrichum godetiae]|uniref:Uncharacterized protein n=1 Tax=Colletotrichum godetiae TaxID=1209918 RepID=A0AAJ0ADJ9_9PEZI|nr:uncharacterized protein BDP55DRAFT_635378 [Colletotrichum godetiae]KAK1671958.1 hypothetical protein BDP55DRAFT_635378 [Colletotrichum godetiae]